MTEHAAYHAPVIIDYTNHRGERHFRTIEPKKLTYGISPYHTEPQWFLIAFDYDKNAERSFAMKDIHSWNPRC